MTVAKSIDDYIENKYERQAIWIVKLSNGESIFMDDDRPGLPERSAWLRLKEYVKSNGLDIEEMIVKFRSHVVRVNYEKPDGFFFRHGILGSMGSSKNTEYYLVGTVKDGILSVRKYQVPEIEVVSEETRDVQECRESIIFNGNKI